MLICLTGLHRSGKSYFSSVSGIPQKHGFKVFNKKDVVVKLCKDFYQEKGIGVAEKVNFEKKINADASDEGIWDFCNKWYGEMMEKDPYNITEKIIKEIMTYNSDHIILDAIHNNKEWEIIHELVPDSGLLLFSAPKEIRDQRSRDVNFITQRNIKRIGFWCNDKNLPPLPYMALGVIDGAKSQEEIETQFVIFIKKLEILKSHSKNSTPQFVSPLDIKLRNLMSENELLAIENANLRLLLEEEQALSKGESDNEYI